MTMSAIAFQLKKINPFYIQVRRKSLFSQLGQWVSDEERNHLVWAGIAITAMAVLFLPLTMTAILLNGSDFSLIIITMFSFALVVITNLSALPTRFTIPAFVVGVLIDLLVIVASFALK
jgi:hypothetical protein